MSSPALTLQLFAKAPVAGAVKTRLIPVLGADGAAALQVRMLEQAAGAVAAACAALAPASGELWCSPDCSDPMLVAVSRRHGLALRAQPAGDLGTRMRHALLAAMPGRVILLGSDCPALDAGLLCRAANALAAADVVIVPVEDGGYALIGCRERVPACFDGIPWSTAGVMTATRARLAASGARWLELPTTWDVDTAADFERILSDGRHAHLAAGLKPRARP